MAEPNIPKMKPDEKLLKQVDADNKKLKDATMFKEEAPTYKDHKATSSNKRVKKLNK
jgi:hypothetical protein